MATVRMTVSTWRASHTLAAELAQRNFDNNLLRTAASYMKSYPDADLHDWLDRLARLGDIFRSSDQTELYRRELQHACKRLEPQPRNGEEWSLVLGWAGRLQPYYSFNLDEARRISNVSDLHLPPPPQPFQPPQPAAEDELPEVREEVSPEAEDIFAQLQSLWANSEEED